MNIEVARGTIGRMLPSECAVRSFDPTREFRKSCFPTYPIRAALGPQPNRRILVGLVVEEAAGASLTSKGPSPM